jgi:NYN domain
MDPDVAHIFWDNSNLFARTQDTCDDRAGGGEEPGHRLDVRIRFTSMFDFAACGRKVERAVAVGSVPPELVAIWQKLGKVGLIVDLQERGAASGKEQGVDQALQLEMMNSLVDRETPAVAVLLTGDGDFRPSVDRLLKHGWGVEVLCFSKGFSPKLQKIATGSGGRGKYVKLDPWYRQLTYLQAPDGTILRHADVMDLKKRIKA